MPFCTEILGEKDMARAVHFLKSGQVVAFATETVYGLGAPIFAPDTIAQIFSLKGRPADNPLIVHIADLCQIHTIAVDIPKEFYSLAEAFFPGPCTVILKKHPCVPSIVTGGRDSIAVRMPSHPIAKSLIAAMGEPLAAPSANLSGKPSPTTCSHVLEDFSGKIVAVIDGGQSELGIESTVISLLQDSPLLLRPGTITKADLEEVLGVFIIEAGMDHPEKALSPGMKYRHYCPRTPIRIFHCEEEIFQASRSEARPMLLTRHSTFPVANGDHFSLSAKDFYARLRYADAQGYSCILILCDELMLKDHALKNRLFRACGIIH